jgi:hypothetical protein
MPLIKISNKQGGIMANLKEHEAIVAKYTSNIDHEVIKKMLRTYALVLTNRDSQFVSCSNENEKITVRENFLKRKLGLTDTDESLNKAIEDICQLMNGDQLKSRLAFYYLLAEKYNKLGVFS